MDGSKPKSFFQDLKLRELNGFRVRKRQFFDNDSSHFADIGSAAVEHNGEETPPLAISYCKTSKNSHIIASSDEDGYVSIYNSNRRVPSSASKQWNAEKSRVCDWIAHQNAVFDISWTKDDTSILTASGDQTIKKWDVQKQKCIGVLAGHTGSVKSLCSHPTNSDLIVSGSRDGSFAFWDLRCESISKSRCSEFSTIPTAVVKRAHISTHGKRVRWSKTASMSITSVLYLKNEVTVATAGAVDSIVKFWDTRNLKSPVTQASPQPESSTNKERRLHGISSLSQDSNGVFLSASCMDSRIYLYNILQLDKGPVDFYSGCRIGSFFVKSKISPDATHILSGSSDGSGYIWQVNRPNADPIALKGHQGEVTSVDWCPHETGRVVTSSDDFTVRFWNAERRFLSRGSPSAIRRRVMGPSAMECKRLFNNEETACLTKHSSSSGSSHEPLHQSTSSRTIEMPEITTPESRKFSTGLNSSKTFERTPEASVGSPSSVLDPPSSLKKTIRDYFAA